LLINLRVGIIHDDPCVKSSVSIDSWWKAMI